MEVATAKTGGLRVPVGNTCHGRLIKLGDTRLIVECCRTWTGVELLHLGEFLYRARQRGISVLFAIPNNLLCVRMRLVTVHHWVAGFAMDIAVHPHGNADSPGGRHGTDLLAG